MQEDEYLLLSGIQHFAFCRRQWALIHIEQAWTENVLTLEGKFVHERAHEASSEKRGDLIITRGMPVISHALGIQGICDIVEFHKDETGIALHGRRGKYQVVPIEYKRGRAKNHDAEYDADALQLCAQAMCLEEMLVCSIPEGFLFYNETKRRTPVVLTDTLRQTVQKLLREMHEYFNRGYTPKVKKLPRCKSCSLSDLCLPSLMKATSAAHYVAKMIEDSDI